MRRKSSDYQREIKDEPFELELEATKKVRGKAAEPIVVKFVKPSNALPISVQEQLARWQFGDAGPTPREISLLNQMGGDQAAFDAFWAEWRNKYPSELDDLVADIDKHFADGLDEGKGRSSAG